MGIDFRRQNLTSNPTSEVDPRTERVKADPASSQRLMLAGGGGGKALVI